MFVGSLLLVIHIPAAQSLKDRRRVVNKLKDRIRARLSVSVCELGDADRHQIATIGVATVARDAESCRRVLEAIKSMAETIGDAWLTEANGEVTPFGTSGQNLRGGIEAFGSSGIFDDEIPGELTQSPPIVDELLDGLLRDGDSDSRPKRKTLKNGPHHGSEHSSVPSRKK
jgi:uncharacterized protein YlxP (DUF503 family)